MSGRRWEALSVQGSGQESPASPRQLEGGGDHTVGSSWETQWAAARKREPGPLATSPQGDQVRSPLPAHPTPPRPPHPSPTAQPAPPPPPSPAQPRPCAPPPHTHIEREGKQAGKGGRKGWCWVWPHHWARSRISGCACPSLRPLWPRMRMP